MEGSHINEGREQVTTVGRERKRQIQRCSEGGMNRPGQLVGHEWGGRGGS